MLLPFSSIDLSIVAEVLAVAAPEAVIVALTSVADPAGYLGLLVHVHDLALLAVTAILGENAPVHWSVLFHMREGFNPAVSLHKNCRSSLDHIVLHVNDSLEGHPRAVFILMLDVCQTGELASLGGSRDLYRDDVSQVVPALVVVVRMKHLHLFFLLELQHVDSNLVQIDGGRGRSV